MATYSSNTTIKYSGTQVAVARITTGTVYTVPAGKTFIGTFVVQNTSSTTTATLVIDSVIVVQAINFNSYLSGPLYLNAGAVVTSTNATSGITSIFGVLQENTP